MKVNDRSSPSGDRSDRPDRSKAAWNQEIYNPTKKQGRADGGRGRAAWESESKMTPSDSGSSALTRVSLILFFLILILSVSLLFLREPNDELAQDRSSSQAATSTSAQIAELEEEFNESLKNASQHQLPLPEKVAQNFTQSTDPQARLQWCRHPAMTANLLENFPEQALSEVPTSLNEMDSITTSTGLFFHRFSATFANGDRRLLALVHTDDGPKIDWQAYARHSQALQNWTKQARTAKGEKSGAEKAFADLEKELPTSGNDTSTTAEVRVFLSPANYYNFRFSDSERWAAFTLTSPDLDESPTAYAKIGAVTGELLSKVLTGSQPTRMTLHLERTLEDASRGQYKIKKVLAVGWLKGNGDFEAHWQSQQ